MKTFLIGLAASTAAFAVLASPASAHHSGAMFDRSKTITLNGTVRQFEYTNPHSWLRVVVTGDDGKPTEWGFEAEGPSSLLRVGIKAKTFMPGDKVSIQANPMKDGRPAGALVLVTKADGSTFSPRARAPASATAGAPVAGPGV